MMIIDDWLEDRLAERTMSLEPSDEAMDFAILAGVLRAEAQCAGYDIEAFEAACGGAIPLYLMNTARPRYTDAA